MSVEPGTSDPDSSPGGEDPSALERVVLLVKVSRPIIWPVLPIVYALGIHAAGASWSTVAWLQAALLTFPMNLIGCGLNDLFDYESDRHCTRRGAVWGVVLGASDRALVWRAAIALMPLVVFGSLLTRDWDNFVATVSLVLIAWLYSVPPARLKERPPLDSLSNGLGYFLLPLMMGYSLGADPRAMPLRYYLIALCVGGIHALAAAADYEADRAAGHRTIAVVYGRRAAAITAFAAFLLAALVGDFHSAAVRVYLSSGAFVTFLAAALPQARVIAASCTFIYIGFLVAALAYLAGI